MKKRKCDYCNQIMDKSRYLSHLERTHQDMYTNCLNKIIELNNLNYTIYDIAYYLGCTSGTVLSRIEKLRITHKDIKKPLKIKEWSPQNFQMETSTSWSFPARGNWATHNGKYRGNWSPYIPRNIILRYSQEGDIVLDLFLGSGTTLIETKLLKRYGIGIDINPYAINMSKENLRFNRNLEYEPKIILGNSLDLSFIKNESIDLICSHPPYGNIINYSKNIKGDISLLDMDEFLISMEKIARESYRVLKNNKFCAILMGDTRKNKNIVPLGFKVMEKFLKEGFILKEIIIKEQHNCKATGFWYRKSIDYNFLLIAHEYLFVFQKPNNK